MASKDDYEELIATISGIIKQPLSSDIAAKLRGL